MGATTSAFLWPSSNASPFRSPRNTFLKYVSICLWVWQWNYQTLWLWHDWIRLQLTSSYHCQTPFFTPRGGRVEGSPWKNPGTESHLIICPGQWPGRTIPVPPPTPLSPPDLREGELLRQNCICLNSSVATLPASNLWDHQLHTPVHLPLDRRAGNTLEFLQTKVI